MLLVPVYSVSILLILEIAREGPLQKLLIVGKFEFQSFLSWKSLGKNWFAGLFYTPSWVSILLILEIAREAVTLHKENIFKRIAQFFNSKK